MTKIEFSSEDKDKLVQKLQQYFEAELKQEIGRFDAEFLLDFFSKHLGAFYYDKGILNARAILDKKVEDIAEAIYELEINPD